MPTRVTKLLRRIWPRKGAGRGRLLAVAGAAVLCGALAWQVVLLDIRQGLDQALLVGHRAIQTEIDRYRYLPRVAGEDIRIQAVLRAPNSAATVDAANRYLERVMIQSGSGQLYLLNDKGVTLAASNWNTPTSYVGRDYSFRPYYSDAMANGSGAVYAIGVTTGEPGYFISAAIGDADSGARGVLVVKIDLRPLEQSWAETGQTIAVSDRDGMVFLSAEPEWRYRPLLRLTPDQQQRLDDLRIYDGMKLGWAAPLLRGAMIQIPGHGLGTTARSTPFEMGWRALAAAPIWPASAAGATTGALVFLTGLLGLGLIDMRRHRKRLIALRLRQSEVMEQKVHLRTAELKREIEARRQVESDLRAAQASLVQSEKMAALGRMSAAIVHEVSQPLAAMEATLTAAEFSVSNQPEKTAARLQSARRMIGRMQRMTKHLKNFSRNEPAPLGPVPVVEVAQSALAVARPRADQAGIQFHFQPPNANPVVRAGPARLEQILINLLHNAIEAVTPGVGEVTLVIATDGADLRLTVRDNGPGIPADVLPRMTEPFFSTKVGGEGLGLGLAICFEVVQQFGGRLDMRNRPDGGAEISVILPLLDQGERTAAE